MTFTEARDLLVWYNKWRRDNHIPNSYKMPNPTDIGKAIDVSINALSECIELSCETQNDLYLIHQEMNHCKNEKLETTQGPN